MSSASVTVNGALSPQNGEAGAAFAAGWRPILGVAFDAMFPSSSRRRCSSGMAPSMSSRPVVPRPGTTAQRTDVAPNDSADSPNALAASQTARLDRQSASNTITTERPLTISIRAGSATPSDVQLEQPPMPATCQLGWA